MAKIFRRSKNQGSTSGQQPAVQTPGAIALTIVGILIVGATLFGIFKGSRWAFSKLATTGNSNKSTTQTAEPTQGASEPQEVTITSSTSTTTSNVATPPTSSTPASTPVATASPASTAKLPQTGAGNYAYTFLGLLVIAFLTSRAYLARK